MILKQRHVKIQNTEVSYPHSIQDICPYFVPCQIWPTPMNRGSRYTSQAQGFWTMYQERYAVWYNNDQSMSIRSLGLS